MQRILKEPLLHFLLLGALIFAAYQRLPSRSRNAEAGTIIITHGQIEHLVTAFTQTWQRPPTEEEVAGLVQDRIREEVYCREAKALGLDQDDIVIRRRLRQKMEFVSDDIAAQEAPTDAELTAFLNAHPAAFRVEPRFTFQQVYLNPEKHGENLTRDAEQMLARLRQAGGAAPGDASMLEPRVVAATAREVANQFGEKFAARLPGLTLGQWQGPIESGYGAHLVLVSECAAARVPALGEVRDAVRREWDNVHRLAANDKFYQDLLKRYVVSIEGARAGEPKRVAALQ